MNVVATKVVVAIIFGLLRFFFGILPVKLDKFLRKWEESSTDSKTFINEKRHQQVTCAVAMTQSFGGGVMFATCFLHIMKTLFLTVEEIKEMKNIHSEFPISQTILSFGFFFIYFLEEFTHWMVNNTAKRACNRKVINKVASAIQKEKSSALGSAKSTKSLTKVTPVKTIQTIEEWDLNQKNNSFSVGYVEEETHNPTKSKESWRSASATSRSSIRERIERANSAAIESLQLTREDEEKMKDQEQLMRCVLTIAALSLHSILEGLSIGIQKNEAEIWYLFIAVSIHSASILFCMSVELILAQTRVRYIIFQMAALAVASPIGILLGLIVTETSLNTSTMPKITVFLEGLSGGTILYITFFEVLNREKERRVYRFKRCLCIMCGFTLMAFLQYAESKWAKETVLRAFQGERSEANITSSGEI